VPCFILWTARFTFCEALGPYFLPLDLVGIAGFEGPPILHPVGE
jgi:hypothetical protein